MRRDSVAANRRRSVRDTPVKKAKKQLAWIPQ
jgi:hypothetical protein